MYFTPDWDAARESLRHLASMNPKIVCTGHGVPLRGDRMLEELRTLAENFDELARPRHGRYVEQPAVMNLHGVVTIPPRPPLQMATKLAVAGVVTVGLALIAAGCCRGERRGLGFLVESRCIPLAFTSRNRISATKRESIGDAQRYFSPGKGDAQRRDAEAPSIRRRGRFRRMGAFIFACGRRAPERWAVQFFEGEKRTARFQLAPEGRGYFSGSSTAGANGAFYKLAVDGELYPDPAARFQPDGVHGPSQVIDPTTFQWSDAAWPGVTREGQVIYEMHIGTFTREGTWRAAIEQLPELGRIGITILELMPVAEFAGKFGWGYDGVDLFAPTRLYGRPDDFRAFVDRGARSRNGSHSRRCLQPFRTGRELSHPIFGSVLQLGAHQRMGRVAELRLAKVASRCVSSSLRTRPIGSMNIIWTGCVWTPRNNSSMIPMFTSSPRSRACGAARCRNPEGIYWSVKTNRSMRGLVRTAARRRLSSSTPFWNDDLHHTAHVAAHRMQRGVLYRLPRDAAGIHLGREVGIPLSRTALQLAKSASWHPALDRGASRVSSTFLQNHDQLANSLRGGVCTSWHTPGVLRALTAFCFLRPEHRCCFRGRNSALLRRFFILPTTTGTRAVCRSRPQKFLSQFPSVGFRRR